MFQVDATSWALIFPREKQISFGPAAIRSSQYHLDAGRAHTDLGAIVHADYRCARVGVRGPQLTA